MDALDSESGPFGNWRPVDTIVADDIVAAPLRRLSALLDHDEPPWPSGVLPALGHWLFFLPEAGQSALGDDGHPLRGDDLPPVPAQRRMWAGSRIEFLAELPLGGPAMRRSRVVKVEQKTGRSGALTFVTVRHEIGLGSTPAIVELQDLVYRDDVTPQPSSVMSTPIACNRIATARRTLMFDPQLLFRFSALTYNAHRIHYDLPYALEDEHYPGLVVQGPLQATLLIDHLLRVQPGARLARFFSAECGR
jgi:3-methylfumaryl-CoA hydratase